MQLIQLTKGLFAKVDDEDFERVTARGRWQTITGWKGKTFYAKHTDKYSGTKVDQLLHRFVLGIFPGNPQRVDHINRDGLDCQKHNLRIVTVSMNHFNRDGLQINNSSGVTGVHWSSQKQKWQAELKFQGKKYHLGFYDNLEDATQARTRKEKELWTSFQSQ